MADTAALSPALRRALDLFAEPPAEPDVRNGYLDLLPPGGDARVPTNAGAIQAVWASTVGAMLYDGAQAFSRRVSRLLRPPIEWLNIPAGGIALDVGCGPGSVTALLARAVGPDGLALGVDVSEPMLARAVRAQSGPQVAFLRANAQQLPLRDATVDAVVSIAVLQLIPDPSAAVAEMARVLRPGGRLILMVPTAVRSPLWRMFPKMGARLFGEDELGDTAEAHGFVGVRTRNINTIQWVRATRG
ncbi:methyltransferase domain-containing protein [Mycobacterium sp.]|uniref:methyltransferase domain-containing protein n=1 Tax=Mycobacterium sp. TaxID=1785 RepID=UPI0031E11C10